MRIIAVVEVPEGDKCNWCDLWYRADDKKCHCLLFGMVELTQRYRDNMVSGIDIFKCRECLMSQIGGGSHEI